jgi:hypothetical protein
MAVYRGTVRVFVDAQTAAGFAKTVKSYLIVNYTTRESTQILYFTKVTKKMKATATGYRIGRAILPNSKIISIFASGSVVDTNADEFQFGCALLRGNDVGLVIETTPARRSIERPRTLTGDGLTVASAPGDPTLFQDSTVSYTLDNAKTFDANNGDKSVTVVKDEILAALAAQGYVEF